MACEAAAAATATAAATVATAAAAVAAAAVVAAAAAVWGEGGGPQVCRHDGVWEGRTVECGDAKCYFFKIYCNTL